MSELTPTQKRTLGVAGAAVVLAGAAVGLANMNKGEGAPKDKAVAVGEAPADLDTSAPDAPVIVEADTTTVPPVAQETPTTVAVAPVESPVTTAEAKPSAAELEAKLRNPAVGQATRYANNAYNAKPDAQVKNGLGDQAAVIETGGWFGSPEIVEMPDGSLVACSTETSDDPQDASLQIRCTSTDNLVDVNGNPFNRNDVVDSSISFVSELGDAYTADPAVPGYESEHGHAIRNYANESHDTVALATQG